MMDWMEIAKAVLVLLGAGLSTAITAALSRLLLARAEAIKTKTARELARAAVLATEVWAANQLRTITGPEKKAHAEQILRAQNAAWALPLIELAVAECGRMLDKISAKRALAEGGC